MKKESRFDGFLFVWPRQSVIVPADKGKTMHETILIFLGPDQTLRTRKAGEKFQGKLEHAVTGCPNVLPLMVDF